MSTYLERFIPNLAVNCDTLRQLTKQYAKWELAERHQDCFDTLKSCITHHTNLAYFDDKIECQIITDASPVGLGAMLVQKVVAYASRSLTKTERNYSQTKREELAVVWASEKFHLYLYGKHDIVFTDHKPLLQLYSKKGKQSPRIFRWSLRLSP